MRIFKNGTKSDTDIDDNILSYKKPCIEFISFNALCGDIKVDISQRLLCCNVN